MPPWLNNIDLGNIEGSAAEENLATSSQNLAAPYPPWGSRKGHVFGRRAL